MMTLLQCIGGFLDNIAVTDKQEENIKGSISNLTDYLKNKENGLFVKEVFTNGSYERDTIIRPLNDIDLFAVLKPDDWKDEYGNLPTPQVVLKKFRDYLDGIPDYKGKVFQDRPCVTIELSNKSFDVLPSFEQFGGGYSIPNYDLKSWTYSFPEKLTDDLNAVNKLRSYKVKPTIQGIKYWNRENNKLIPSFHVEEVAINIFNSFPFANYEESIRLWFNNAEYHLIVNRFKSVDNHTAAINKIKKVKGKLNDAKKLYDESKESEAIEIWKDIFNGEFPTADVNEAKNFSKSMADGTLKVSSAGTLSAASGNSVPSSKGFYGEK